MAVAAAYEAVLEAGLSVETLPKGRTALINGCAGSAYGECWENMKLYNETRKIRKITPLAVPRVMPSSAVSNISLLFGITGESYDVSCACTSSAMCIVLATRLIRAGLYDIVIVGGSEELSWSQALGFCTMRALSKKYNAEPGRASRPFDRDRDGFVLAEGAGMLVLESESHALARGWTPKGVVSGIAANSNATDMVVPNSDSSADVMRASIADAGLSIEDIAYINTHGTATPVGDPIELEAIKKVFGDGGKVAINSTKSMTGHMIGAAGAVEAIFCSVMCEKSFICPSANLENPEDGFRWADLVRETRLGVEVKHALSNSFGFGGSNACLVVSRWDK
jgi:3-oxoacyl-[acyl-carrier-protein] synthase-1